MSTRTPCRFCGSTERVVIQGTGRSAERCFECGSLFRYLQRRKRISESDVQAQVLQRLAGLPWLRVWRNNVGLARTMDGNRVVRFGVPGAADISGILSDGRRLEIEVKGPGGHQTKEQRSYQMMIESMHGLYILVTDPDAILGQLHDAGYPA